MNTRVKGLFCWLSVFVLLSLLLSGCGGAAAPAAPAATAVPAAKPQTVIYAIYDEPLTNWDPAVEFSSGNRIMLNIYETLVRYDPETDKVTPLLATEWSQSADGLAWTFKLRKGVKFHDGSDFNAQAVKFSMDRTIRIGQGASYIWGAVNEVKVVDDSTVEFDLKYKAPIDLIASTGYAAFIYSPKSVTGDDWFQAGKEAGTGPYVLKSFKWGDEVVLQEFPDYWGGWPASHISTILYKKYSEPATRREMIEKGDAQITSELPFTDINALKNNPNVTVNNESTYQNLTPMFNTQKPPLDNKLVRQALSYAFPYQQVIETAMGGYATQAHGLVPAGMWGHSDSVFTYTYDLEKAKALLTQAGHPGGGFKLLATYLSGDEAEKNTAELYKTELSKIGVDMEIRAMPWDSQWAMAKGTNPADRQDIFIMYWWPDMPSPYSMLFSTYHSEDTPNFNLCYYKNPTFDKLIDDANELSGADRTKAAQMFVDAQNLLMDDAPAIAAYDRKSAYITTSNLMGLKMNPAYPTVIFFYGMNYK